MRHELYLARVGFRALVPLAVASGAVGYLVAGARGAASAGIGVGLVAANHLVAVLSTGWAPAIAPRVIAVGYAVFVARMLALLAAFASLAVLEWLHTGLLAAWFCAALVVTLGAECLSYARRSYVPEWRRPAPHPVEVS